MTDGTTGFPARTRATRKAPTGADFPLRVPLIHGESTLSFLTRTAGANGLPVQRLLRALHQGRLAVPKGLTPSTTEAFLTTTSISLLADLVGRAVEQLERALPNLAPAHRLPAPFPRLRLAGWPQEFGQGPLPTCPLCLEGGAWLVARGRRWRPCGCGRRWMVGDGDGYLIDTTAVPELARALQHHRELDHRLGAVGDALVVDAHQVVLWWWVDRQVAHETWREREDVLGFSRGRRRVAPVVVYPEAVRLAELMWQWERRRSGSSVGVPDRRAWLEQVAGEFAGDGIAGGRERTPLAYWLEQHPAGAAEASHGLRRTAAQRRWARLPGLHGPLGDRGLFRITSCLRWVYGLPLTSSTGTCPRCGGRAPSCRWVPADDCVGEPRKG